MVPRSMYSSNIDYSLKTILLLSVRIQIWDINKKHCNKYSRYWRHFPTHIPWLTNEEIQCGGYGNQQYMVPFVICINSYGWWFSIKHFYVLSIAEMWFDNNKYDWKLTLINFTSRSHEYRSATNIITIWTSYSNSLTSKTSHCTSEPLKYLIGITRYLTK